jgi:hypothetical protein
MPEDKLNKTALNDFVIKYIFKNSQAILANMGISKRDLSDTDVDSSECAEALSRLEKGGEDPNGWTIHECRLVMSENAGEIKKYTSNIHEVDKVKSEEVAAVLKENPSLRFYLYSSQLDLFSPPDSFEEEVKILKPNGKNFNYRSLNSSGHEGFWSENAIWRDLAN